MKRLVAAIILGLVGLAGTARAMPIMDTVVIEGREWAQIDIFLNLTWNEVNAVCPLANDGLCTDSTLAGWDMAGWQWGSVDDVNTLFNSFLSAAEVTANDLLDGPDDFFTFGSYEPWSTAFFDAGFRPNLVSGSQRITSGRVRNLFDDFSPYIGAMGEYTGPGAGSGASTSFAFGGPDTVRPIGAWIFRPASTVPVPSTLVLLIIGAVAWRVGNSRSATRGEIGLATASR